MGYKKLALFSFIIFASVQAKAAIKLVTVASATTNNGSATSVATGGFSDTNNNDLLTIQCMSQFAFVSGNHFTTPTTTSGLVIASTITSTTQIGGAGVWYACTSTGGFTNKTLTCNWNSAGPGAILVEAWSGTNCNYLFPKNGIGGSKACNGTTGTTATCTNTTSANNAQVIGNGEDPDQAFTPTAGTNQTAKAAFNDGVNAEAEWGLIQNSTTATAGSSVSMNITNLPSGDVWNSTWVEMLPAVSTTNVLLQAYTSGYTLASGATHALKYPNAVQAGSLLAVWVAAESASGVQTVTVSDDVNGSWTQAGTYVRSATIRFGTWFYFPNSAAGTPTVTVTATASVYETIAILEYRVPSPTGVSVDASTSAIAGASVSSVATGTCTVSGTGELVLAGFGQGNAVLTNFTGDAPFGVRTNQPTGTIWEGGGTADNTNASSNLVETFHTTPTVNSPVAMAVSFITTGGGAVGTTLAIPYIGTGAYKSP